MSDEYIKREDAIKASTPAFRNAFSDWEVGWIESKDDTKDMIENLPSADVAPVRHGHWICLRNCSNAGIYCSACHKKVYEEQYSNTMKPLSPWCPNCGAKMDEDSEPLMEHEVFFGKE